jgi:hypothetical protein
MTAEQATDLRTSRNLRALENDEAGSAIPALPAGIYGFTYSPNFEQTPLFQNKSFQSFEFHKLADGSVELVGFMTSSDAQRLRSGDANVEVRLYPDPWQDAQELVTVPMDRITRSTRRPARENGCPYTLRLE